MDSGFDSSQIERLRRAEEAETELMRLQPVAAEAAQLRQEKAKAEKAHQRQVARDKAMSQAQAAVSTASESQVKIPSLLGDAGRAVSELYRALKEIDSYRMDASKALAIADRVDYEIEVEEAEEHETSKGRDPRGMAYAVTAKYGKSHVKRILEEMDPDFSLLRGCNLDDALFREMADFIVRYAVGPNADIQIDHSRKVVVRTPKD